MEPDPAEVRSRWTRALVDVEETEELGGPALHGAVATADAWRRRAGLPPLAPEAHPEEELHRRARALKLSRRVR